MINRLFQRVQHRIPANVQFSYGPGRTNRYAAEVVDISVAGLSFILGANCLEPVGRGARARVLVQKGGRAGCVESSASIVRCSTSPDSSRVVAVNFDRVWYDIVASLSRHHKIIIELNPYGWQSGSRTLNLNHS